MGESEKKLEAKLGKEIKALGGWSIKLLSTFVRGLPDRMCLLPTGIIFFVELKSTGKKPRPAQAVIHKKLRDLGFLVYVIDSSDLLEELIDFYKHRLKNKWRTQKAELTQVSDGKTQFEKLY